MAAPGHTALEVIRQERLAVVTVLAVVVLAGANWILSPEQALRWLRAMLVLPLVWLVLTIWHVRVRRRRAAGADDQLAIERYFRAALTLAVVAVGIRQVVLFSLQIWVRFGDHAASLEAERRVLGLATSAIFVIVGNALPKILTPLAILPVHLAERVTSARRFIGTTWVVLGVVMAAAFLFQPLESAKALERWSVMGGFLTMLVGIVWMNAGPDRRRQ